MLQIGVLAEVFFLANFCEFLQCLFYFILQPKLLHWVTKLFLSLKVSFKLSIRAKLLQTIQS